MNTEKVKFVSVRNIEKQNEKEYIKKTENNKIKFKRKQKKNGRKKERTVFSYRRNKERH